MSAALSAGTGETFLTGFRSISEITDEVKLVLEEDSQITEKFGNPVKLRFVNSSYNISYQDEVTVIRYEAPISGPLNSGTVTATIKKLGDEVRVTSLRVYTDSGDTIQVRSE